MSGLLARPVPTINPIVRQPPLSFRSLPRPISNQAISDLSQRTISREISSDEIEKYFVTMAMGKQKPRNNLEEKLASVYREWALEQSGGLVDLYEIREDTSPLERTSQS